MLGSKRRGVVCTASTCYCSSSLNVEHLLVSVEQKQIQYSSEWGNSSCNMLNNTNILYVFNPILLTVFAADLGWSQLLILLTKHSFFIFFFIAEVFSTFFSILLKGLSYYKSMIFHFHQPKAYWFHNWCKKGFYVYKKYNFFISKTNKQAELRWEKWTQRLKQQSTFHKSNAALF